MGRTKKANKERIKNGAGISYRRKTRRYYWLYRINTRIPMTKLLEDGIDDLKKKEVKNV
jgi:hypothetical protein